MARGSVLAAMSVNRSVILLALLSALSLTARVAWLDEPCQAPCRTTNEHPRIFDETYYVSAARVIVGIRPPSGGHYAQAPLGVDPNAEHPQGVKLVIAAAIELFGDGPFAWRVGSLIAGSLAILGMWWLARAAGAPEWVALLAAALMATDNLLLVAGRIGTLDIYGVAAMVWAVALYLRGRWLAAAAALAVGMAFKEVVVYGLLIVVVLEVASLWGGRRGSGVSIGALRGGSLAGSARRAGCCAGGAIAGFIGLLAIMDRIAPPYDPGTGRLVSGGVFGHLSHIISYASALTSPHGPQGIASYPWEWLGDLKPIVYLNINPSHPSPSLERYHPASLFLGMVSPPVLLLAIPALGLSAYAWLRRSADPGLVAVLPVGLVGSAWFAGTWGPFEAFSLIFQRTSYLYYMVIVMPGIYLAVAALIYRMRRRRRLVGCWMACVILAAVWMYPFTPFLPRL